MKFSKRKTFCQDILFEDKFLDLPLKVRWFYLCLNYGADDDGFTDCSVAIAGFCSCTKNHSGQIVIMKRSIWKRRAW